MSTKCRNTPIPVQRQLRQEAHFGCCRCGHPLLDNAHIIAYNISHAFPPEDMVSLCPTCHRMADSGGWSEKYLRELKTNPYNKSHVTERFLIEGDKPVLNLGGNRFVNTPRVLIINDFELITLNKELDGYLTLNLSFFDRLNNLVGIVDENKWTVDTSLVWDLEYKPKHLTIRNAPREISFEVEIRHDEVYLRGNLFFMGHPITIHDDELLIQSHDFFGTMKGCTIEDGSGHAINLQLGNLGSTAVG